MSTRIKIKGRMAFANIFTAKAVGDGAPRYGANIIFAPDSPDNKIVKDGILAEATTRWGAKAPAILKAMYASAQGCLQNGDTKAQYEGFEGLMFVSAGQVEEKGRPSVRNLQGRTVAAGDPGVPYSGCYVVAIIDLWAQDNQYGKKVNAELVAVQFAGDGAAFSGRSAPVSDDDFEDLSAQAEEDVA